MKVLTSLFSILLISLLIVSTLSSAHKLFHGLNNNQQQDDFIRNVTGGTIQGMASANYPGVGVWKNIPFADAPRFQPPTPPTPWSGVRATTAYGPGCINTCTFPKPEITCPHKTSEDCLNLNVFSPDPTGTQGGLPVFFWSPGGRMQFGGGSCPLYTSDYNCQEQNVVVVTINYRLGAFGALTTANGLKGSYNLQDQIAALQWVRANIAKFGGDPTKVTIAGQSAGAMSVSALLASPAAKGLFHAAAMSSQPFGIPFQDVKTAQELGKVFLKSVGCSDLASSQAELQCLSTKPVDLLLNVSNTNKIFPWPSQIAVDVIPWTPTVDPSSDILPVAPFDAAFLGKVASEVPIMLGNTANDSLPFIAGISKKPMTELEIDAVLVAYFGLKNTIKIKELYPKPTNPDARFYLERIMTDYIFGCANRNYAANVQKKQGLNAYFWYFNHMPSFNRWLWSGSEDAICAEGPTYICHATDLPFVFSLNKNVEVMSTYNISFSQTDVATQQFLVHAYGSLTRSAKSPNVTGWNPLNENDYIRYNIEPPFSGMIKNFRSERCDFFDSIGYTRRGS